MAVIDKTFLDLAGLDIYDSTIKDWANTASQLGYKTVLKTADGSTLNFYKKPNAVLGMDTPDATVSLSSYVTLTGTLTAGSTTLTLTNSALTTSSLVDIYTDVWGFAPSSVAVTTGSITMTFTAQGSDVGVKVLVR